VQVDDRHISYLLDQHGYAAILTLPSWFWYLRLMAWVVILSGLLFFKNWARIAFPIFIVISFGIVLIAGTQVTPPLQAALLDAGSFLDAFILCLIYFSPASEEFEQ
jgi:hypothetical protein